MYIKSVVLDGFKSYGRRTEINGFDSKFTAITGLNGSGKSNIIDSICFVLGISNLTHVRAASLQDLIYKSGTAGINKATVTLKFDNTNKNQSPPGFENVDEIVIARQVMMGGKNKYLLNGLNVTNKRIQDLFCSVQLNVNNPHFLIMQGRITKVLNMKPVEILAMIEEAAGTRMYEVKKQIALKNLTKKNSQLDEMKKIFYEDVEPKIHKLREERAKVFELQRLENELVEDTELYEAWQYHAAQSQTASSENQIKKVETDIQNIQDTIQENKDKMKSLEQEADNIIRETKSVSGTKLEEFEAKLKEKTQHEAKITATDKGLKDNIITEEKNLKQLDKSLKIDENALKNKESELSKVQNLFETLKNNAAADEEALAICQRKFEAICAGMEVDESGEAQTLMGQLMNAKQAMIQSDSDIKICQNELDYNQDQLNARRQSLGNTSNTSYAQDANELERFKKETNNLQNIIKKMNYNEEHFTELSKTIKNKSNEVNALQDDVGRFYASRPYTRFRYTDPEPNFNRKSVCGLLCNLINIKDKAYCTAIETAAGSMLYSVIVTNAETSKKLIQLGNLERRTTFIPLNKVTAHRMNQNIINTASNLVGRTNAIPALDLITYDRHLQPAMESIFGNVFITKDLDVAKQVCFHNQIRRKCVTLDGDVVDPAGTLSGGSVQRQSSVLLLLDDVKRKEIEIERKVNELHQMQAEVDTLGGVRERWFTETRQLEFLQHQSNVLTKRLESSTHYRKKEEVEQLQAAVQKLMEKMKICEQKRKDSNKNINDLENKMKDSKGHQDEQRKKSETELKKLKKKSEMSKQEWAQKEEDYRTLNLEIEELKKTIENTKQEIVTLQETIAGLKTKREEFSVEVNNVKAAVQEIQEAIKTEKAEISSKNKEVHQKNRLKEKISGQNNELELQIQKLNFELKKVRDEHNVMKSKFKELNKKCRNEEIIKRAKKLNDAEGLALEKKIRKNMQRKNELSRAVNLKAHQLYEHEVKAYENLKVKMDTILKDTVHIKDTITKLDRIKEELINKAFQQVTKDIGSILGTLLPGANAKLAIPRGKTILEGLEIHVALGNIWKDSLTELSGGQRSLVALSFILAMLLFNPAPLYILDEIDAALDLSHTQNIGAMLKQHFRQSQFIIISLKDGMFTNANVLFKTQFIDAMSSVSRTSNL